MADFGVIDDRTFDPVDISSLDFWARPPTARDEGFVELRRRRPVSFHRPITFGLAGMTAAEDPGFWAVASHSLVRQVSRDPETFCSSLGTSMEDIPPELLEETASFLAMDGERHHALRRLISSAFSPRNVARIEAQIQAQARLVVDRLLEVGDCDFVEHVSMRLPMWTIAEMIGFPEPDRERIARAANTMVVANDPSFATDAGALATVFEATMEVRTAAIAVAGERRARPRDDLMTALVEAEIDDRRLTDNEIGAFCTLLAIAGNDTTRQTTSHGMKALCDNPEQRALLIEDPDGRLGGAVEEIIRWATPVVQFRRTATRDVTLGGQQLRAKEKVVLLYASANRDDSAFVDPWTFDVLRAPNEHLGFGGGGPHYCLGAHLARTQLRSLFRELLTRVPNLEVGEPQYGRANFINGITTMACTL